MKTKDKFPMDMVKGKGEKMPMEGMAKKKANPFAKKFAAGGKIDGVATKGKTKGKMC